MGWINRLLQWFFEPRDDRLSRSEEGPDFPTQEHPSVAPVTLPGRKSEFDLRVGVCSVTGNVREHNEDNYYVPGWPSLSVLPETVSADFGVVDRAAFDLGAVPPTQFDMPTVSAEELMPLPKLFLVADGMGGQLAGEQASKMAVDIVPEVVRKQISDEDDEKSSRRLIRTALVQANDEILAASHLKPEQANMGTTIVLVLIRGARAYVAGIGDSRAYRLRNGTLDMLTTDHSLARALVEAGTIRPEEAESHKFRHVLYNYLGCTQAREGPDDIRIVEVRAGDRFLLASDGLTGVVSDSEIVEVLQDFPDPQVAAQALVKRALDNRSKDNVTCVVVQVL